MPQMGSRQLPNAQNLMVRSLWEDGQNSIGMFGTNDENTFSAVGTNFPFGNLL
jgi:hypothetical protein